MRRVYYLIRGIGYVCGIAAVLLILWGGRGEAAYGRELSQIGYVLLLVMFLLFCASYVLFAAMRK